MTVLERLAHWLGYELVSHQRMKEIRIAYVLLDDAIEWEEFRADLQGVTCAFRSLHLAFPEGPSADVRAWMYPQGTELPEDSPF